MFNSLLKSLVVLLLATVLFQGFQCSSKEMAQAKISYGNKDYDVAITNLELELRKNPTNDEAKLLLATIKAEKLDFKGAAKVIVETEKVLKNNKLQNQIAAFKSNLWVTSFNASTKHYNMHFTDKLNNHLDSAIYYIEVAKVIHPDNQDLYYYHGIYFETKGDTLAGMEEHKKYIEIVKPGIEAIKSAGISYNQNTQNALSKTSKPKSTFIDTNSAKPNSLRTDLIDLNGKSLYLFSFKEANSNDFKVKGWRYNPPTFWSEFEKSRFWEFNTSPLGILAQYYYTNKQYREALVYLKLMVDIEPNNLKANQSIVQCYQELGEENSAFTQIEELIAQNPDNATYYVQYGDMLINMKKNQEAIDKYEQALKIEPTHPYALRNIASAYKNKASVIQNEEQDKVDKDPRYEPNYELYFPLLDKSASYFTKTLNTAEFNNDFEVLSELANIYQVTKKSNDLKRVLEQLESIELTIPQNNKTRYYYLLLKIYSDNKNREKTDEINRKIEQLSR